MDCAWGWRDAGEGCPAVRRWRGFLGLPVWVAGTMTTMVRFISLCFSRYVHIYCLRRCHFRRMTACPMAMGGVVGWYATYFLGMVGVVRVVLRALCGAVDEGHPVWWRTSCFWVRCSSSLGQDGQSLCHRTVIGTGQGQMWIYSLSLFDDRNQGCVIGWTNVRVLDVRPEMNEWIGISFAVLWTGDVWWT